MWSDRYHYFNIYSDEELTSSIKTAEIRNFLLCFKELKQKSDFNFKNQIDFPFTDITLLNAKSFNSWSNRDTDENTTNLISIVCVKDNIEDLKKLTNLFNEITIFLDWRLVEED